VADHQDLEGLPSRLIAMRQRSRRLVDYGELAAETLGDGIAHQIVQPDQHVRQLKRAGHGFRIAREKAIDIGSREADHERLSRMPFAKAHHGGRAAPRMQRDQEVGRFILISERQSDAVAETA